MDPFLSEIKMLGANFAPRGYAFCNGQLISIAQNSALFALLGTTYGGDGVTTFALPNLQSRVPIGMGQGPGLSPYQQGQGGGTETVALTQNNLPAHNHAFALPANSGPGNSAAPANNTVLAASTARDRLYTTNAANTTLASNPVGPTGGNQPFSIIQPYLGINFIIAIEGIFPSRN